MRDGVLHPLLKAVEGRDGPSRSSISGSPKTVALSSLKVGGALHWSAMNAGLAWIWVDPSAASHA